MSKKKVYMAMSGGVDSSAAAALLKEQGYFVVGVYMKTWEAPGEKCTWREDRRDAMRVCATLNIPFKTWDFRAEYKKKVVDYMIAEYSAGATPNPDIMCNKEVKFGLFFDRAMEEGADYIATGHYARVTSEETRRKKSSFAKASADRQDTNKTQKPIYKLLKGANPNKDQTYFLWTLGQRHLAKTLFPIGGYKTKEEIRNIARRYKLANAEKRDSQGVCFIGPIDVDKFLRKYIPNSPGPIVSVTGRQLGQHDGLPFYTIGQRQGIGIGGTGPYYVARKEQKTNTLVVAPLSREEELLESSVELRDVNFVGEEVEDGAEIEAAVRYRQKPVRARFKRYELGFKIEFKEPVRAITPGQSLVFYKGNELLGGGVIS